MKKYGKSTKRGFTLVELIVVLVILAVLAAMLIPALTGYIRRAREEKEYQAASTVYAAGQALLTEAYGKGTVAADGSVTLDETNLTVGQLSELTGLTLSAAKYTYDTEVEEGAGAYVITAFSVQFEEGGNWYCYDGTQWTIAEADDEDAILGETDFA